MKYFYKLRLIYLILFILLFKSLSIAEDLNRITDQIFYKGNKFPEIFDINITYFQIYDNLEYTVNYLQYLSNIKINLEWYEKEPYKKINYNKQNVKLLKVLDSIISEYPDYRIIIEENIININPVKAIHCGYLIFRINISEFNCNNCNLPEIQREIMKTSKIIISEFYSESYYDSLCPRFGLKSLTYSGISDMRNIDKRININLKGTSLKEICEEISRNFLCGYRVGGTISYFPLGALRRRID